MLCAYEVDVALARPPRADATVYVLVDEPLDQSWPVGICELGEAMRAAELRARSAAGAMAATDRRVVMPIAIRLIEILEV